MIINEPYRWIFRKEALDMAFRAHVSNLFIIFAEEGEGVIFDS
jgi:hypothetical protein